GARRDRGPAADGAPLLQRHGPQPEHQHPVLPQQPDRRPRRLPAAALFRDRGPHRARSRRRVPGEPAMRTLRPPACALLVVLGALAPAAAQERVLSFLSDVEVERNGDLLVTETIRVQAQGNQIRRGILRDFPTTYTRPGGTRVVVGFAVEAV